MTTAATRFDRDFAESLLARVDLELANRALARHWLGWWKDGALPARTRLEPAKLKSFLPNLILFDVVPDRSVTVRLAGTLFRRALGTEITGKDWVAVAPAHYRAERLRIISQIARGAVGIGHRRIAMRGAEAYVCEEILLPFAAEACGTSPVLVHVDWHPQHLSVVESAEQALGDPIDFKVLPLR